MSDATPGFRVLIHAVLLDIEVELNDQQYNQLEAHYQLLERWNQRISLTTIRDPRQVAQRHFGESLFVGKHIPPESGTLIDVGSGAGFPGVPIAVLKPSFEVILVESVGKKVAFLKELARSVPNLTVFHGRVESLPGQFDWATVRAVRPSSVLPALSRLVHHVAFLLGPGELETVQSDRHFQWSQPQVMPWSERTCLLIGREAAE